MTKHSLEVKATESHLLEHVNGTGINKSVLCPKCNLRVADEIYLSSHIDSEKCKQRLNRQNLPVKAVSQCDICGAKVRKAEMKMHMRKKHSSDPEDCMRACEFCGDLFSKMGLVHHLKAAHLVTKETPIECSVCQLKIQGKKKFDQHVLKHGITHDIGAEQI